MTFTVLRFAAWNIFYSKVITATHVSSELYSSLEDMSGSILRPSSLSWLYFYGTQKLYQNAIVLTWEKKERGGRKLRPLGQENTKAFQVILRENSIQGVDESHNLKVTGMLVFMCITFPCAPSLIYPLCSHVSVLASIVILGVINSFHSSMFSRSRRLIYAIVTEQDIIIRQ